MQKLTGARKPSLTLKAVERRGMTHNLKIMDELTTADKSLGMHKTLGIHKTLHKIPAMHRTPEILKTKGTHKPTGQKTNPYRTLNSSRS